MEELRNRLVTRSPGEKRKKTREQVQAHWDFLPLHKLITTQELADSLVRDGGFSAEQLRVFSVEPVVLQTLEQLDGRQQELQHLLSQLHQQLEDCKRFQQRLVKVWLRTNLRPFKPFEPSESYISPESTGPADRRPAAEHLHYDGPGFGAANIHADVSLQAGQTTFHGEILQAV